MATYKRGSVWYYNFMIRRKRYRGSIPEARTKAQAERVETQKREEVYNRRYGGIEPPPPKTLKAFARLNASKLRADRIFGMDRQLFVLEKSHNNEEYANGRSGYVKSCLWIVPALLCRSANQNSMEMPNAGNTGITSPKR